MISDFSCLDSTSLPSKHVYVHVYAYVQLQSVGLFALIKKMHLMQYDVTPDVELQVFKVIF